MKRWRLFTDKGSAKKFANRKKADGVKVSITEEVWVRNGEKLVKYRAEWQE